MAATGSLQAVQEKCEFGYRCVFEGDTTDYVCSSCKQLLREPCNTTCCEQSYCRAFLEGKKKCPGCLNDLHFANNYFQKKALQRLEVLCIDRDHGCPWKGKIQDLDEHHSGCDYVRVSCEKCQQYIRKIDLETHREQDCPERSYSCPHCNLTNTYSHITTDHIAVCPSAPVACPNRCGLAGGRDNMEDHLENDCPLRQMACPFNPMGCEVKFVRGQEDEHLKERTTSHLSALAGYTLQLTAKLEEFRVNVGKREGDEAKEKRRGKKMTEVEEEISILRKKVEFLSQAINNPPEEEEISPPEAQAEADRIGVDLERKLEEKDTQIQQLSKSLETYKAQQVKLERRLVRIEDSLKASPVQGAPNKEYTNTLTGFMQKKKNKENWTTPILRDEPGLQHKLKLITWANGQRDGKNTHVSVWLEQEDINNQPAHIFVFFELLNQLADENHIQVPCHFHIENGRYVGAISNILALHSALDYNPDKGTQFLVDDSLKIRVQAFLKPTRPSCWQ